MPIDHKNELAVAREERRLAVSLFNKLDDLLSQHYGAKVDGFGYDVEDEILHDGWRRVRGEATWRPR